MVKRRVVKKSEETKKKVRRVVKKANGETPVRDDAAHLHRVGGAAFDMTMGTDVGDKRNIVHDVDREFVSFDPTGVTKPWNPDRRYLDAWSVNNKIFLLYRNPETGRKEVEEVPYRYYIFVLTKDVEKREFKRVMAKWRGRRIVTSIEPDPNFPEKWHRIYIDLSKERVPYCDLTAANHHRQNRMKYTRNSPALEIERELRRQANVTLYEADLEPPKRFVSEWDMEFEEDLWLFYFDIETDDRFSDLFTNPGKHRIVSFAWKAWNGKKAIWEDGFEILDIPRLPPADTKRWRDRTAEEKEECKAADQAEIKLLKRLKFLMEKYDQTVTWNGYNFDLPQVLERMKRFGISIRWTHFSQADLLNVFKRYHMRAGSQATSYALQSIGEKVLNKGKVPLDGRKIHELFEHDRETLRVYNIRDVDLIYELEEFTAYLSLDNTFKRIGNCWPRDFHISTKIDGLLLKKGFREGVHFKTRNRWADKDESEKITGAFVLDPTTGMHEDVCNFDFKSLYPSMMITFNISPETLVARNKGEMERLVEAGTVSWDDVILVPGKGTYYWKPEIRKGYIPQMFEYTLLRRKKYTNLQAEEKVGSDKFLLYYRLAYGYKRLGLSFYGELANPQSRFYDPDVGESVTRSGQYFTKMTMAIAREKFGYEPVYGDTDSLFIKIPLDKIPEFMDHVHDVYREDVANCNADPEKMTIELEYEDYFSRLLMVRKKRYAGIMSIHKGQASDFIEIKGLEIMRSDVIQPARDLQREVCTKCLRDKDATAEDLLEIVLAMKRKVYNLGLDEDSVIQSKGLQKDIKDYAAKSPHVKVAQWILDNGYEYFVGMKVPFVMIKPEKAPKSFWEEKEDVETGEMILAPPEVKGQFAIYAGIWKPEMEYDQDFYWDHLVYPATLRVLEKAFPEHDWIQYKADEQARRQRKVDILLRKLGRLKKRERAKAAIDKFVESIASLKKNPWSLNEQQKTTIRRAYALVAKREDAGPKKLKKKVR